MREHLSVCRVGEEMGQLVRENDFSCLCFVKPNTIVLWVAITSGRGGLMSRLYMRLTLQKQFVLPMLRVFKRLTWINMPANLKI